MNTDWKQLLTRFNSWYSEAQNAYQNCLIKCPEFFPGGESLPHAMGLSTVNSKGIPSSRIVLMKEINEQGLSFFTNYESKKGLEIKENSKVSCLFHWIPLVRQVVIRGTLEKVNRQESEQYWNTRPRLSQVSGSVSRQDQVLSSYDELKKRARIFEEKQGDDPIPCPLFWGGYRLTPYEIEFWQGDRFRLHQRELFIREGEKDSFKKVLLSP